MTDPQKPEREFIDIGAGYKVATVGQGSTFRVHGPSGEMVIVSPTFYHPFYTTMAQAIKAEREATAARVLELEAENKRLWEGLSGAHASLKTAAMEARHKPELRALYTKWADEARTALTSKGEG